jgi:hypothetical protein
MSFARMLPAWSVSRMSTERPGSAPWGMEGRYSLSEATRAITESDLSDEIILRD